MKNMEKTKDELLMELQEIRQKYDALKNAYETVVRERKGAELAKNRSENRYRLLAQNSSDVIWTLDNDYRFTYISPSIYHLRGLTPEEAMRESIEDTMTPQSYQVVVQAIIDGKENEAIKNYVPSQVEIQQYHKDGHLLWVEIINKAMLNDEGEKIGYVGISRDITLRKMAEKELLESEAKLRELNAQKDKFFSIIAHDLKSPFNAILGFSELLMDQINEKNYGEIQEYANIIVQSSQRAMDLLMNLLEWSRAQTGRMEFNPESFDLAELMNENIALLHTSASQKSISTKKDFPQKMFVYADVAMMSTILRNLISNAIKFTHEGGEIKVSAEKKSAEILVGVSDNGVGISPKRLEKLFVIGESDSTPGTGNEQGTGLGLILCKEFVENHGGKIWAKSEQGKGSSFYFTIPFLEYSNE